MSLFDVARSRGGHVCSRSSQSIARRSTPRSSRRGPQPTSVEVKPTIAEGTAITKPIRLKPVLEAIRRSGGSTVAVTEEEIVASVLDLAGIGLYAEPTSATAAAAYTRLLAAGTIKQEETTIVVLTGSGLKATQRIGEILGDLNRST